MRHPVDPNSKMVSIQVPQRVLDQIEKVMVAQDITRAEVIRRILEQYFGFRPYVRAKGRRPDKDWEKKSSVFIKQWLYENPDGKKIELAQAMAVALGISYSTAQDRISRMGV